MNDKFCNTYGLAILLLSPLLGDWCDRMHGKSKLCLGFAWNPTPSLNTVLYLDAFLPLAHLLKQRMRCPNPQLEPLFLSWPLYCSMIIVTITPLLQLSKSTRVGYLSKKGYVLGELQQLILALRVFIEESMSISTELASSNDPRSKIYREPFF